MSKYKNKKLMTRDGLVFDSKREYRRYAELVLLQKAGHIKNLQRQVKFELIPAQYLPTGEYFKRGEKKGQPKMRLAEKGVVYIADFVYETADGLQVVEDTKGMRTRDYIIKRKLMLYLYGIKIKEV